MPASQPAQVAAPDVALGDTVELAPVELGGDGGGCAAEPRRPLSAQALYTPLSTPLPLAPKPPGRRDS
eukprot:gene35712-55284_t